MKQKEVPEMGKLLGLKKTDWYWLVHKNVFESKEIAEKKRITKESFQKFLEGQDRYKLDPSNDYEELAQEQNIALANFRSVIISSAGN